MAHSSLAQRTHGSYVFQELPEENTLDTGETPVARPPLRCDDCGKELNVFFEAPDGSRLFVVCPCVPLVKPGEDLELEALFDRVLDDQLVGPKHRASPSRSSVSERDSETARSVVVQGEPATGQGLPREVLPEETARAPGAITGEASHRCPSCGRRVAVLKSFGSESIVAPCNCAATQASINKEKAQRAAERAQSTPSQPEAAPSPARPPMHIAVRAQVEPPVPLWRALSWVIVVAAVLAAAARFIGPTRPDGPAIGSAESVSLGSPITDPARGATPEEIRASVVKGAIVPTATFQTDQEGRLTLVSGRDPDTVLHALCRHVAQRGKVVPVSVSAAASGNPDVRDGVALVMDGHGTTRTVTIRRDPRTARWTIGNGVDPIGFDERPVGS